ncbi:MAG TPA: hypothetical protein DDZ39_12660 [Flavobacteriaceae bacterium]|nr:hypothetical protein [Flavobacteriaceae bacterium]
MLEDSYVINSFLINFKNKKIKFYSSTKLNWSDLEIMSVETEVRCDSIMHGGLGTNEALAISLCLT